MGVRFPTTWTLGVWPKDRGLYGRRGRYGIRFHSDRGIALCMAGELALNT